MRILVFFDLPVCTTNERRKYREFRSFLIKDGYIMLQFSVYCRLCNGNDAANKHLKRLKKALPKKGAVRAMIVTDKQYGNMQILIGDAAPTEQHVGSNQVVDF